MTTAKQTQINNSLTLEKINIYGKYHKSNPIFTKEYQEQIKMAERNDFYAIAYRRIHKWESEQGNAGRPNTAYDIRFLGRLVGVLMAKNSMDKKHYWMNFLLIDKKYQGKGFGRKAVELFEGIVRERGQNSMVDIDIQNPQYISKMPRLVKFYKSCGYDIGGINPDDGNLMLFKKIYNGEGCECCSHNQKVMSEKKKFRPQMREGECEGCEALCEECENLHIVEEEEEEYDGEDYEEFLKMKAEKLGMTVEEYVEAEHKMNQQSHLSIEGKTNEDYEKEYDESRKAEAEKYNMTVEELEEAEEDYRQVLEEARYDN